VGKKKGIVKEVFTSGECPGEKKKKERATGRVLGRRRGRSSKGWRGACLPSSSTSSRGHRGRGKRMIKKKKRRKKRGIPSGKNDREIFQVQSALKEDRMVLNGEKGGGVEKEASRP